MPAVYLIEGPVGSGKSTYSALLAKKINGVHIALDEWFVTLFSPDRPSNDPIPWYIHRKERLIDMIWRHSLKVLGTGTDVILELGLIQRQPRIAFYHRLQNKGIEPLIHVIDAPLEMRRQRVSRRNIEKGSTFFMIVPDHIFDMASSMWEAPDDVECSQYKVSFPTISKNIQ